MSNPINNVAVKVTKLNDGRFIYLLLPYVRVFQPLLKYNEVYTITKNKTDDEKAS